MLTIGRLCIAALLCVTACTAPPEPEPEPIRHPLRGEVVQLRPGETNGAVIAHEEIPGWMGAMTMTFPVLDQAEFAKLHVGDYVQGEVVVARGVFHLENIAPAEPPADPTDE